ncbi:MAG TPA: hypothetical protein VGX48_22905 [Pyrinomonadaceae bacterium]|jgi:hypothetical protein|nr:hypothetical protein [Pyrinomonadaceae bacterium]
MADSKFKGGNALMNLEPPKKKILTFGEAPTPPTPVPEYRGTGVPDHNQTIDSKEQIGIITPVPEYRGTGVPEHRNSVIPESRFYRKANEASDTLDRKLTAAESKVFDQLLRLTVGLNKDERQVRISVLQQRTGYGSDKTIRTALAGLLAKGVIARVGRPNNPGGDIYRILSYSGTGVPEYRSTAVESTAVPRVKITGELNTDLKEQTTDDELRRSLTPLLEAAHKLTGREASDWREVAEVLAAELKIAAGRTTVSSAPAFLAEHLRRRLWKKEKRDVDYLSSESEKAVRPSDRVDASDCPDCYGTGMCYPEGFDKGVARCTHPKLPKPESVGDGSN